MKMLTALQKEFLARLVAAGESGLTLDQLGVKQGRNAVPALIFARHAEHVHGTEPARYRATAAGRALSAQLSAPNS